MLKADLIEKFPKKPLKTILYVVYEQGMIAEAAYLINEIWGEEYLNSHVIITTIDQEISQRSHQYDIYLDPVMQSYKYSWNT